METLTPVEMKRRYRMTKPSDMPVERKMTKAGRRIQKKDDTYSGKVKSIKPGV